MSPAAAPARPRSHGFGVYAVLACLSFSFAIAAAPTPDWLKELSPVRPANHPAPPPGTLVYDLSWKGVLSSGEMKMEIGPNGAHKPHTTVVKSTSRSMGMAAGLFPYKSSSWAEIHTASLRPLRFSSWESNQEETITTENRFQSTAVDSREETVEKGKTKPQIEHHLFPYGPAYDLSSALLYIRSQPLKNGDRIHLLVHPYNTPYLMRAKVLGRENHAGRDCIHLAVEMQKIDRNSLTLKPYKKLKAPASLWLSDDKARLPIEIRAEVFIGDVRATLTRFDKK